MQLLKILKFIYNHPFNSNNKVSALMRFLKWQINCRLNPYPIIYPYTENSKLVVRKGLAAATGNLYCGLMEYYDMGFLLHFLRPADTFVDIGGNIGAYTILASAEIDAKSIAIEPIPNTFKMLNDNIIINNIQDKVKAINIGLGSKAEKLNFTKTLDSINHVATEFEKNTIEVEVKTLDSVLNTSHEPSLIKIDVEGFETEVILGAEKALANQKLKAIIIELNGSGVRYGYNEVDIHRKLLDFGFTPHTYDPKTRELIELELYGNHNTIYIRDKKYVMSRVKNSREIKVGSNGQAI